MRKYILFISTIVFVSALLSCGVKKGATDVTDIIEAEKEAFRQTKGDTIEISSNKTEYEIIIIEPGFNTWFRSLAKPEGYYSQSYFETRNLIFVTNWNQRVLDPNTFDPTLYEMQINYNQNIDYGYEVNYKLYYYFIYFQRKYQQRLGPFVPRI